MSRVVAGGAMAGAKAISTSSDRTTNNRAAHGALAGYFPCDGGSNER